MIKATGQRPDKPERRVLYLGLSRKNIERLQAGEPIAFALEDAGAGEGDVYIFAGEDETAMAKMLGCDPSDDGSTRN